MNIILIAIVVVLLVALAGLGWEYLSYRRRGAKRPPPGGARRILFPYVADGLSQRALDAALRLASAEDATLVAVFLARVSMHLPLDTPLPRQCASAIPLQEAIEQRATASGVAVDNRIERGRTYRHALRQTIAHERFDRIVVAATAEGNTGFDPDDVAWLLANAPGEIVVLRPDEDEQLGPPVPKSRWQVRPSRTRERATQMLHGPRLASTHR
jgi:nucleotide-binding universal stress UspA family protein